MLKGSSADVIVVGGGVMGLMTAYFLTRKGARVVVVERDRIPCGSSYGNAGLIVPSHLQPLCSPANVKEGLAHLFRSDGPFAVRLSANPDRLKWFGRFLRHSTSGHVAYAVGIYGALADRSVQLHDGLAKRAGSRYGYRRSGLLCLYETAKALEAAYEEAETLRRLGRSFRLLDRSELEALVPHVGRAVVGAILQEWDGSLHPAAFVGWLAEEVTKGKGEILEETEVFGASTSRGFVRSLRTSKGSLRGDQVVLAAGAWTGVLSSRMGVKLPVEPAKGYSLTFRPWASPPPYPLLLEEARLAVTPFSSTVRLAGILEFSGFSDHRSPRRLKAMRRDFMRIFPKLGDPLSGEVWHGFRPCTPDGLPCMGRLQGLKNVFVATGHATKGIFLAPVTGEWVTELLEGRSPDRELEKALDPNRF